MCRLMYLPKGKKPNRKFLAKWFDSLAESQGGDGFGFASMRKGIVKGVALTADECARQISQMQSAVVWHTRAVSSGPKIDDLCHPFEAGRGYLVHNGHWSDGDFMAGLLLGNWSDTAVAALAIARYGWNKFCDECYSGVWIRLTRKGRQVAYKSGDLYTEKETGILCSEPNKEWGDWARVKIGEYGSLESVQESVFIGYSPTQSISYVPAKYRLQTSIAANKLSYKSENGVISG